MASSSLNWLLEILLLAETFVFLIELERLFFYFITYFYFTIVSFDSYFLLLFEAKLFLGGILFWEFLGYKICF